MSRLTTCARKRRHTDAAAAESWARIRGYHRTQRPYYCALCRHYHLTTRGRPLDLRRIEPPPPPPRRRPSRAVCTWAVRYGHVVVEQDGHDWTATLGELSATGSSRRRAVARVLTDAGAPDGGDDEVIRWVLER